MARTLVLTIGKSALPVAVAARVLLNREPFERVVLVHTPQSGPEAKAIADFLKLPDPFFVEIVADPAPPPARLVSAIAGSSHFHYSGGTTAMAQCVQQARHWQGETSYLSLLTHRLVDGSGELVAPGDLRRQHRLSVNEVAALHGWYPVTVGPTGPIVELSDRFAQVSQEIEPKLQITSNANRLTQSGSRSLRLLSKPSDEMQIPAPVEEGATLDAVRGILQGKFTGSHPFNEDFRTDPQAYWDLCAFLSGGWFQFRVEHALRDALNGRVGFSQLQTNTYWCRQPSGRVTLDKQAFETDIAFVYGYQLVLVSCTSGRRDVKLKAFEAYLRARQLGGAGARVIVISRLNEKHAVDDCDTAHLDIGLGKEGPGAPRRSLDIWGSERVGRLCEEFSLYLNRLTMDPAPQ